MLLILRGLPDSQNCAAVRRSISFWNAAQIFLGSLGAATLISFISAIIQQLMASRGLITENPLQNAIENYNIWLMLFLMVVVAPIMEEFIFRRILYKKLARYGEKTYVTVSALIFGLFHMNIYQLFYAFVLGLVFGCVTWRTGNTRRSTILHFFINLFGSGIAMLLSAYAGESAAIIWEFVFLALAFAGLVIAVVWLFKGRKRFSFEPGTELSPPGGAVYGNAGMITFITVTALFSIAAALVL
jgi:membrane protease YdiL (CAAX protease family)